jgi:DNA-directed RNA polymerase subunit N (RpoN/RPB10)
MTEISNNNSINNVGVNNGTKRRTLQEFGYDRMTLLPVRCLCNRVIGNKQDTYESLLSQGYSIRDALDKMGIKTTCCREKFINPPKLPAGIVLNQNDEDIKELYNSFGIKPSSNYENNTGNPYYNQKPLDPNKPKQIRTFYLTQSKNKINDLQRQRIADIEALTISGPSIPVPNVEMFTADLESAFNEINLEALPNVNTPAFEPEDLYYIRKKIDALNLGYHPAVTNNKAKQEFGNIIDRLLINLVNYNNGYEKARSEMIEKKLDPLIIDSVEAIFRNYKRSEQKIPSDKEFTTLYNLLKQKYPNVSSDLINNAVLRYLGLGTAGQQWRLDPNIQNNIRNLGIDTEAFASPFNSSFPKYYSIFTQDAPFGSLGSFFSTPHPPTEAIYANPPFVPQVLEDLVPIMAGINVGVVISPTWRDAPWYNNLIKAGYTPHVFNNIKYRNYETEFTPRFETTIWTKGVSIQDVMKGI